LPPSSSGFDHARVTLSFLTSLTSSGPLGLAGAANTTTSTLVVSEPLAFVSFMVYLPPSDLLQSLIVTLASFSAVVIEIRSFSLIGLSLSDHSTVGNGSPTNGTSTLSVSVALIVICFKLFLSILGFT
jgi:hypothetical protein